MAVENAEIPSLASNAAIHAAQWNYCRFNVSQQRFGVLAIQTDEKIQATKQQSR